MSEQRLHDLHISAVERVNEAHDAGDPDREMRATDYLCGIRDAMCAMGYDGGHLIMAADHHYIDQGCDRAMCGGLFLDDPPKKEIPR